MHASDIVMGFAGAWLCVGLLVGLPFVTAGVARVVPAARDGSVMFRLLILPGVALLWPLIVWTSLSASRKRPAT